jgi:hypothetical protein
MIAKPSMMITARYVAAGHPNSRIARIGAILRVTYQKEAPKSENTRGSAEARQRRFRGRSYLTRAPYQAQPPKMRGSLDENSFLSPLTITQPLLDTVAPEGLGRSVVSAEADDYPVITGLPFTSLDGHRFPYFRERCEELQIPDSDETGPDRSVDRFGSIRHVELPVEVSQVGID